MLRREFEHYYRKLYMQLGMYALRLLGNVDDAEDAVQEAFASAWLRICDQQEIDNFKAYIYRAVRNNALMKLRARHETVDITSLPFDIPPEDIDTSERDARLWHALDKLPPRCRQAFLLSKRDGLSYAEIAEETGTSIKTVENQISKAFRLLRKAMSESETAKTRLSHPLLPFL